MSRVNTRTPINSKQQVTTDYERDHDPSLDTHFCSLFYIPPFTRSLVLWAVTLLGMSYALQRAYTIRIKAIEEYGFVIHEFDPWFNYRATEYLSDKGWEKFFHWYDYMSWYPLGRPVGTTIYPGLQITSVLIHRTLQALGPEYEMTLTEICCYVPAWFGIIATLFLGLLTYETTGSPLSMMFSSLIMAIIPAHMMRSVGGGYDNESIAMTAICSTFYFWVLSLRSRGSNHDSYSWLFGILTGLSYGYMVAAWGGYIFVLNMIALHCVVITLMDWARGHYSPQIIKAYGLFYVIGTAIATYVPPVNMTPFKSLEQLAALAILVGLCVLHVSEYERKRLRIDIRSKEGLRLRLKYVGFLFAGLIGTFIVLLPTGFFGPLSSRVRGLFVQHMKTGNPLVDSVAEHQPGSADSFFQYLHIVYYIAPWGFGVIAFHQFRQSSFLILNYLVVQYFALKMARLIILSAVPNSALAGAAIGMAIECIASDLFLPSYEIDPETQQQSVQKKIRKVHASTPLDGVSISGRWKSREFRNYRIVLFSVISILLLTRAWVFTEHAERMAESHSHTSLIFKHNGPNGVEIIDDYREAYWFLRDKTPEDSRVLAWWDYGYQITGIGNRTTLADGNTWNHEHIATVGRCLTSPQKQAHRMIRHLADYVLVWSGGGGDDLAKSPWMARIGNSVYNDICPNDPLCEKFGFKSGPGFEGDDRNPSSKEPTPMMARSLLYNLHMAGQRPGVGPDPSLFEEAYTGRHGLIRIFKVLNISQESKAWAADPANRVCDAPGSWYCTGRYPPARELQEVLEKRTDFQQLEDFNRKKNSRQEKQNQEYLERSLRQGAAM